LRRQQIGGRSALGRCGPVRSAVGGADLPGAEPVSVRGGAREDSTSRAVAMGFAASMAQVLLSSGTRGKRFALPNARVVMHQPLGGIGGSATDVRIQAEQLQFTKRLIARLTAEQTRQPLDRIVADADRDRWFTADQARDYGIVDHVMGAEALVGA
jgi:ATP-dependent Clp endopeptidase proteolytic subunit ClpP